MTYFSDIYNRAIFYFADYSFLDIDEDERDELLKSFLMSTVTDFIHSANSDLSKIDETEGCFENDLEEEEIEILALGIAYRWLSRKVLNSALLKNLMTRSDYTTYSPANLLDKMSSLRDTLKKELRLRINEYSYRNGTLDTLKAGD